MKTITIDKQKYIIPESWEDVTLRQQMRVNEYTAKYTNESIKEVAILAAYANIPVDVLNKSKITEMRKLFKHFDFINTELPDKPIVEFDFNGSHYYCGQNLMDAEFQDFISIENLMVQYSGQTQNALPYILAIMCKCKKADGMLESISDYDVMKRGEEFHDLPITVAHQLSLFFSISETMFTKIIPLSSSPEALQAIVQNQIDTLESIAKELAGKGLLMKCVAGILRYCIKYIKKKYKTLYTSTQ